MGITISDRPIILCPVCDGQPTIITCMYGNAYYGVCSECGWCGDSVDVTTLPTVAIKMWEEKAIYYKEEK